MMALLGSEGVQGFGGHYCVMLDERVPVSL